MIAFKRYGENCPFSHSFQNQEQTNVHAKWCPTVQTSKNPTTPPMPTPQMSKSFLEQGKTTYELLKDPQRQVPDNELQILKKNEHSDVVLCVSAISENNEFG